MPPATNEGHQHAFAAGDSRYLYVSSGLDHGNDAAKPHNCANLQGEYAPCTTDDMRGYAGLCAP